MSLSPRAVRLSALALTAAFVFTGEAVARAEETKADEKAGETKAEAEPARADETKTEQARAEDDDPKAVCIQDHDRAQALQSTRKLRDARKSYLACSSQACPGLLREDCARSLVDLDAALPTIVLSAREAGHDVTDVRVAIDGVLVESALDGHAVAVDPGNHIARFERAGGGSVEVRLVAREGEKNRLVTANFTALSPKSEIAKSEGSGRFPTVPLVLGGTGLLALGGSLYLRLDASASADEMRRTCAPACDPAARDALSDKLVIANVALGVGISALALAAATWLFDRH